MDWINKHKQLPPLREFGDSSVYVLVTDGYMIGHGCYNFDSEKWTYCMPGYVEKDDNSITHWMLFPKLPLK